MKHLTEIPISRKIKLEFFLSFVFLFIVIISQCCLLAFGLKSTILVACLFVIVTVVLFFCVSIFNLNNIIKIEFLTQSLNVAQTYNLTLEKQQDDTRCFRHDFRNIIQSIGGYIDADDMARFKRIL